MSYHDLPETPANWTISTNVERHISFVNTDTGRSIALTTTRSPDVNQWNTIGLAQFESPSPIFAENVALQEAIETAFAVIEADDPEEIEPVARLSATCSESVGEPSSGDPSDEGTDTGESDSQASLGEFI
jgi:hypothetical protein